MEQLDLVRVMVQRKIPDKRVRTIWFLCTDIYGNILYGVSGNNNKLFCVAKVNPKGEVEIIM